MAAMYKPCYGFALSYRWLCLAFVCRLISSQNKVVETGLNIMFSHNNIQRLEGKGSSLNPFGKAKTAFPEASQPPWVSFHSCLGRIAPHAHS